MDKECLKANMEMLEHYNNRLAWIEGYCGEIFRDCGLSGNETEGIKRQIFYAQNHLKLATNVIKRALGKDEEECG